MKKALISVLMLLALLPVLTSCGDTASEEPFSAAFTIRPEQEPTEVYFDVTYTGETQQIRSDALDADALRALFAQSLFGAEGEAAVRWASPVRYALAGAFTPEDAQTLSAVAASLTRVSGFPSIRETAAANDAALLVRFDETEQVQFLPETDEKGRILSVQITIPADWDAPQRAAALYRYAMRACGFFYTVQTPLDTVLSADMPADMLTDADYILLEALYGSIEPGDAKTVCLEQFDQTLSAE